jgi:hypothetical protein
MSGKDGNVLVEQKSASSLSKKGTWGKGRMKGKKMVEKGS